MRHPETMGGGGGGIKHLCVLRIHLISDCFKPRGQFSRRLRLTIVPLIKTYIYSIYTYILQTLLIINKYEQGHTMFYIIQYIRGW